MENFQEFAVVKSVDSGLGNETFAIFKHNEDENGDYFMIFPFHFFDNYLHTDADLCRLEDFVNSLRRVAAFTGDEIKLHYLKASGTSEALEACKSESKHLEKSFSQWIDDFFKTMDYGTTRESVKKILDVLSANVSPDIWYEHECHQVAMGIVLAKHIQYTAFPPDGKTHPAKPVRLVCFDAGVPIDLLGSLIAFAKTKG